MTSADESSAMTRPVFGSMRLTAEAGPYEPYCAFNARLNASFADLRLSGERFVLVRTLILFKETLALISFHPDPFNLIHVRM
jgi:hypothetical protein